MTFYEHLKNVLKYPLCYSSEVFKGLFKTIGAFFDQLKNDIYVTKAQMYAIKTTKGIFEFARERGITKLKFETDEQFNNRVIYAFQFYATSAPKRGIESILSYVIDKPFIIDECYQESWVLDVSELGENTILNYETYVRSFIIFFSESITDDEREYVNQIMNHYKPAHVEHHIIAP